MNTNLQTTTNKLVLDFHQRNGQTVLAKEYDKGSRFIPIQCMEHGEPFALDSSIEIQVKVLTPDNRALLEHSAVIQDDGSILLELTENMLYYPGKANVELIFYDFEHKKRLSPMKFDLLIDSSAYPDDRIISSDEFNALTDLLEKANADYTYVITAARESADAAKISEDNAAASADIATTKATEATLNASNAENAANHANISANNAAHSETISANSAASALNSAKEAQSWAHGNTGIREGENTNNSKYWSEQSKEYADSWKGSLLPQGTIAFSQIPTNGNIAGHMYNINEAFVTDSRFKDGAGYSYPAGTNIYWTHDNKWDCLSGTLTMTLTQAEYNNLSNAEKMNGTIYYISDADNSLGNANENVAGLMSPEDKEKLDNIEAGAQVNVQADWNVSDSNSDVYIKNKPQVMKNPSALTISLNGISQGAYDGSSQKNVNITAENIGADSNGTAQIKVSEHNGSEEAHSDIRNLITTLTTRLNTLADSDDITLDQLSEIVAYIKNNKSLIDGITTSKVNVLDIIDNLTSSITNKPLSAKQGKVLNDLITTLTSTVDGKVNKTGDTITGDLIIPNSIPNTSSPTLPASGSLVLPNLMNLRNYRSFLGTYSKDGNSDWNYIINVRHRNGFGDGNLYGIYIKAPLSANDKNLSWGFQHIEEWSKERTILDSINYKNFCLPLSGGIISGDEECLIISPIGIEGNNNSQLLKFNMVSASIIAGSTLIYNGQDIDSRYLQISGGQMEEGAWIDLDSGSGISGGIRIEGDDYSSQYTASKLHFTYEEPLGPSNDNGNNYCIFSNDMTGKEINMSGQGNMTGLSNISLTIRYGIRFTSNSMLVSQINSSSIEFNNSYTIRQRNYGKGIELTDTSLCPSLYGSTTYYDLGAGHQANRKWRNIYAQNGIIQTSDKTRKKEIKSLESEKSKAFIKGLIPCSYEMLDGTSGRTHYGLIAQDIEELMNNLNMDSSDFAGLIKSPKKTIKYEDENGKKLENPIEEIIEGEYDYALRYDEFIAPLIKVVQEQQKTIENQQITIENQHKEIDQIKKELSKIYSPM